MPFPKVSENNPIFPLKPLTKAPQTLTQKQTEVHNEKISI
jgi:hypothetical protein